MAFRIISISIYKQVANLNENDPSCHTTIRIYNFGLKRLFIYLSNIRVTSSGASETKSNLCL